MNGLLKVTVRTQEGSNQFDEIHIFDIQDLRRLHNSKEFVQSKFWEMVNSVLAEVGEEPLL